MEEDLLHPALPVGLFPKFTSSEIGACTVKFAVKSQKLPSSVMPHFLFTDFPYHAFLIPDSDFWMHVLCGSHRQFLFG